MIQNKLLTIIEVLMELKLFSNEDLKNIHSKYT